MRGACASAISRWWGVQPMRRFKRSPSSTSTSPFKEQASAFSSSLRSRFHLNQQERPIGRLTHLQPYCKSSNLRRHPQCGEPSTTSSFYFGQRHNIQCRNFWNSIFSNVDTNFDPLSMPSATILKENEQNLSPEEVTLKRGLEKYRDVMIHQQNRGQTNDDDDDDDDFDDILHDVLDELFEAYHTLGYWEEALGIEQTRCKLYYSSAADGEDDNESDDKDKHADSIHLQGKLYLRQEDFKNSREYYEQALEYFTKTGNKTQRGHVMMSLAGWYYFRDQLDDALELLKESEVLLETNPTLLLKNLDNAGLILRCMGEYKQALEKYEQAFQIIGDSDTGDESTKELRQALCMHMADMWMALDDRDMALQLYEQLLSILNEEPTMENAGTRGVLLHNIATIHAEHGEGDLALEEYNQALQLKIHSGGENNPEVAKTWNAMGGLYASALNQKQQAMECFRQALSIARVNAEDEKSDQDVLIALRNLTVLEQQKQQQHQQQQDPSKD